MTKKNANKTPTNAERRLAAIIASIGEGVISTDISGKIEIFNQQAELISGYDRKEVIGKNFDAFMRLFSWQSDEKRKNLVQRALWNENLVNIFEDVIIQAKDKSRKNIYITGTPIIGEDQQKIGAVFILRDISAQKRTEEELRKVEQLETLGFFAGGLAHDFNNILTTISNSVGRVLLNQGNKKSDTEILEGVSEAVSHAKQLTTQLLTFAKGGSPVLEVVSIADLVRTSAKFILDGSSIDLKYDISNDLWNACADEGQIVQIIQNLVINASQAIKNTEGSILVRCRNIHLTADQSQLFSPNNKFIEISIKDSGVGIPKAIEKNIFTPYFTTKENGSGLGLAVCYSIAKKHNGTLTFESKEGEGSTFFFRIPASSDGICKKQDENVSPIKGTGRILIMDDDIPLLESVASTLRDLGYNVQTARDGKEAIEYYIASAKAGTPFDLVLLDLTVPGKMGGEEAVRQLREIDPSVKAVVSSGYSNDQVIANYKKYGFCGILNKPYQTHLLSKIVRETISSVLPDIIDEDSLKRVALEKEKLSSETSTTNQPQKESLAVTHKDSAECASLKLRLVDQTYYTCKAELSASVLHTIRNSLTPLFLDVEKLKDNLNKIDLSSYKDVVNEFSHADLADDRKEKLIRFLTLSHEFLEKQLAKVSEATNMFTTNIHQLNKIIKKRDRYLKYSDNDEHFTLKSLINDSINLFQESSYQDIAIHISPDIDNNSSLQGRKLLLMLTIHKILKSSIEGIGRARREGGEIRISATTEMSSNREMIHLQIRDNGIGLETEEISKMNDPLFPPKDRVDYGRGLHFCATCMASINGHIYASSDGIGHGTCFHVLFPKTEQITPDLQLNSKKIFELCG